MAELGRLQVVITTNFDTLIEKAFRQAKLPLRVLTQPEDFQRYLLEAKSERDGTCVLMKIHGCVSQTSGRLVDTLAQRLQGLPPAIGSCIHAILDRQPLVVAGFSGSDLRAGTDYLHFERGGLRGRRLIWLARTPRVDPVVNALLGRYRDGGALTELIIGELPEALTGKSAEMALARSAAPDSPHALRPLTTWARDLGSALCAVLLCDLCEHLGELSLALDALDELLEADAYARKATWAPLYLKAAELHALRDRASDRFATLDRLRQADGPGLDAAGRKRIVLGVARARMGAFQLDRALDIVAADDVGDAPSSIDDLELALSVSVALQRAGRSREAAARLLATAAHAVKLGFPAIAGAANTRAADLHAAAGDYLAALEHYDLASIDLSRTGGLRELILIQARRTLVLLVLGRLSLAEAASHEALKASERISDPFARIEAFRAQSVLRQTVGDEVGAREASRRAEEAAADIDDARLFNRALNTGVSVDLPDWQESVIPPSAATTCPKRGGMPNSAAGRTRRSPAWSPLISALTPFP